MNLPLVIAEMGRMAGQPGILGCALVDASTGLVWHASAGTPGSERVWEAAVDYWRLHDRQKLHFAGLGTLAAAVMYHANGVLAVFPCSSEPDLLLVAHGRHRGVDWLAWQCMVRTLGRLLNLPKPSPL
ncbi:hypothetical protein [Rhizobacter sp. SG703]|uniref:hypothetical protein n=1 Tax=Rhizobacter sp. SG703 TaxID=2587140 RepID=UPI001447E386|nr:hypothetical protein [Rhizobacter sp. SG703]NKI97158.1 hypothetical protein [Rhizobacter sp. SG703]